MLSLLVGSDFMQYCYTEAAANVHIIDGIDTQSKILKCKFSATLSRIIYNLMMDVIDKYMLFN